MNAKNLPLKFSFLAVLLIACIYFVSMKGIRQGIDLRGGHSLVYEIRTNAMEIAKLQKDLEERRKELAKAVAAGDKAKEERLRQTLAGTEAEIRRYQEAGKDPSDLADRMIAILKARVDPSGLLSTEWRPLGNNRFEVRMPAGIRATQEAKDAFYRLLDELESGNLDYAKIRRLVEAPADQQESLVRQYAQDEPRQAERLRDLVAGYARTGAAERAVDAANRGLAEAITRFKQAPEAQKESFRKKVDEADALARKAQAEMADARKEYDALRNDALTHGRISLERLQNDVLAHHVSDREAATSSKEGHKAEVEKRRELFAKKVADLLKAYPARKAKIEQVIAAYQNWGSLRGYLDDPADLERLIAKAGVLEFRIVPYLPGGSSDFVISEQEYRKYKTLLQEEGPESVLKRSGEFVWLPVHGERQENQYAGLPVEQYGGKEFMLLYNRPGFLMLHEPPPAGWTLIAAYPTVDEMHRPAVGFEFDQTGAKIFANLTGAHLKHCMAITLDDAVYSAPVIQARISSRGIITGSFTQQEVNELARTLEAGSLPAKLNPTPVSVNNFGPAIGEVNRRMGFKAGIWGLIGVVAFMALYYRLGGLIAVMAQVLNLVLLLGTLSLTSAVLTLPGIAGVILTIGMAVDANVLIFERLREEQARGLMPRMALKTAYERAFSAIFDSNVTTVLTCVILGWVGSEEVRGFAITLGLGIVFSMFTALSVTRWTFQVLLDRGWLTRPLGMAKLIGVPNVKWMQNRWLFWGWSLTFIVLGIVAMIWHSGNLLGIEFTSGTQVVVKLRDDAVLRNPSTGRMALPDDGLVRDLFTREAQKVHTPEAKELVATARVEKRINPWQLRDFLAKYDKNHDGQVEAAEWSGNPEFFKLLDANKDNVLSRTEMEDRLPAEEYQITTTVTDTGALHPVVLAAYGEAMEIRVSSEGKPAKAGLVADLGVTVDDRGAAVITPQVAGDLSRRYPEIEEYVGGALLVFRDVTPPLSRDDLAARIRDMRNQADFTDQRLNLTRILGLDKAPAAGRVEKFTSFLVAVKPSDPLKLDRMDKFIDDESKLIGLAFQRAETGETRHFDAAIAGEMKQRALMAIVLGWVSIIIYLWFRFGRFRWGFAAVFCLVHDVMIVVGLVALSGWLQGTLVGRALGIESFKIDLAMIAAILTIIGYSVNDTIVVFDRIRENRGKLTTVSSSVINASINQTLSRTLLTSCSVFIVLIIMYIWGGPGMHPFSYALLIGVLFGTYSSIAIASPLLLGFKALMGRLADETAREVA